MVFACVKRRFLKRGVFQTRKEEAMVSVLDRPTRIKLRIRDASRQKMAEADAPADSSVGELIQGLVRSRMKLPEHDPEGRPLNYHARLEREGRHLHSSERVGDALRNEDEVVLQPNIQAG
jgi:hypothetical protein